MGRPGMIPPGRAGLIMLAASLIPLGVVRYRPVVRTVGRRLQRWGRTLERMAQEAKPKPTAEPMATPESPSEPTKAKQSKPRTKKR